MVIIHIEQGLLQSGFSTNLSLPILFKDQVNAQKDVGNLQLRLLVPQNKRKSSDINGA